MNEGRYTLWKFSKVALNFNTDNEILTYLIENNIEYKIAHCEQGNYLIISDSQYFITPGLLYFLQEPQCGPDI